MLNSVKYCSIEAIIIKINNSISENQITNYDIEYELKCMVKGDASNYYNCLFDDEENQIIDSLNKEGKCIEDESLLYDECVLSEYTYELVSVFNEHNFKINKLKQNTYEKIEVEVVLTTTSPFSKSLKAIYVFNFGDKNNNSINVDKVKNLDSYCEYTINNNYNNKKTIKINIDTDKMLFDTTDNIISYTNTDEGIVNSITIEINKHGNRMIRVYKKDFDSECNVNNFNYSIVE